MINWFKDNLNYKDIFKHLPVSRMIQIILFAWLIGMFVVVVFVGSARADEIDINAIIQIESSGNPLAYNKSSQAVGLMQITPIVFKEFAESDSGWKEFKPIINFGDHRNIGILYDADTNVAIGKWYLNRIANRYLKGKGSIEDILICYNWGYGNWRKYKAGKVGLPKETRDYIKKYRKLVSE